MTNMKKVVTLGLTVGLTESLSAYDLFAPSLYSNKPRFADRGGKLKQGKTKYPNRFK